MSEDADRPAAAPAARAALAPGTRFGEFEILRVLGAGGFGVVYLANDYTLERQVALKEYMPGSLARRGDEGRVELRDAAHAETYAAGLRSFVNEARLLARFDHPSLVRVYRFWEANATAYMVMPYLQGTTLRDRRRTMGAPPREPWLRGILEPVLDALELLHAEGIYHRDIAPDNIFLPQAGGAPILLDFGAARRVIGDRTQTLTAILKPQYAPIEQYAEMSAMRQGPWTDLYALGAVMHFLLFGKPPAASTARAMQRDGADADGAGPIESRRVPGVSPAFIGLVARMLAVRPADRPQSVAEARAALRAAARARAYAGSTDANAAGAALASDAASTAAEAAARAPSAASAPLVTGDPAYAPTLRVAARGEEATRLDIGYQRTRIEIRKGSGDERSSMPDAAPPLPPIRSTQPTQPTQPAQSPPQPPVPPAAAGADLATAERPGAWRRMRAWAASWRRGHGGDAA